MGTRRQTLRVGDSVRWNTPQGTTTGIVREKVTTRKRIKSHKVKASERNPKYLVRSNKSGKLAAHKSTALTKV